MGADRVTTYSADDTALMVGGAIIDSGYADGVFVTITRKTPLFGTKAGSDGEVIRHRTNDHRADIKIKLLQSSLGNNALLALAILGQRANGADVTNFELVDKASNAVIARADKCWVANYPEVERAREGTEPEWLLETSKITLTPVGAPAL